MINFGGDRLLKSLQVQQFAKKNDRFQHISHPNNRQTTTNNILQTNRLNRGNARWTSPGEWQVNFMFMLKILLLIIHLSHLSPFFFLMIFYYFNFRELCGGKLKGDDKCFLLVSQFKSFQNERRCKNVCFCTLIVNLSLIFFFWAQRKQISVF